MTSTRSRSSWRPERWESTSSDDPAPIPDAGAATALLVDALGSIASALDAAVRSLANAADATQDSLRAYQDAESHTAQEMAKAGEG